MFLAATDAAQAVPETAWVAPLVALVLGTSIGTRVIAWVVANRRLLSIVFEVIQQFRDAALPELSGDAKGIANEVGRITERQGGEVRDIADKLAAAVELRGGSATDKREQSKGRRVLRGLARWAPILGALL